MIDAMITVQQKVANYMQKGNTTLSGYLKHTETQAHTHTHTQTICYLCNGNIKGKNKPIHIIHLLLEEI